MNDDAFAEAITLHQGGRLDEAAALYRLILKRNPRHADSLHLLGLIVAGRDDPAAGVALIRRAMAIEPGRAVHYHSLAQAYLRLGQPTDAVSEYRTALALRPDSPEIHNNLATALRHLGHHQQAVLHYRQAAQHAPRSAEIWCNLANALAGTGAPAEADTGYRNAIRLNPDFADARASYGSWLTTQARWPEAETHLRESVRLAPAQAATWNNLGIVLQALGRAGVETCYRKALALDPNLADVHYNLGCLMFGDGRTDEAITCHQAALAADPRFGTAQLAACMSQLPILYRSQAEVSQRRQSYTQALEHLTKADPASLAAAIGRSQPFFLPYQGEDDRDLQAAYGQFACRALAEPPAPLAPSPAPGQRIRLGLVSGFFRDHTLFKLFLEGWLTHFDRTRFEVIGFHTGNIRDAQTARCAALCDRFVQGLPSPDAWRDAVSATAPHALLYPEVGIDPIAGRLAAMRLAPMQCAAWGQPQTTGMPTIDYFLSSELMEPADGDQHYTEPLVRLPNLGLCYMPDEARRGRLDRAALGLDPTAPVFWSGQALYKYLPQYDTIFPRIAAAIGQCQFVFIGFAKSQAVTDTFRDRLRDAFAAAGLDAARHVVILPPMSQQDYLGAVALADVILDTPGWSGGKSTLDCLATDPAIVTLPGRFMRGRHTAAILRRIGCEATVAASLDDYVSIAVRLVRDPAWRAAVRRSVAHGKHLAFGDTTCVRAVETLLADAAFRLAQRGSGRRATFPRPNAHLV